MTGDEDGRGAGHDTTSRYTAADGDELSFAQIALGAAKDPDVTVEETAEGYRVDGKLYTPAEDDDAGVPDSDPDHLDPAGDMADLFESAEFDVELTDGADAEDLRAFIDAAESGELGPVDPGLEATVRMARAILENAEDE
jgi:hypothetical protein